MNKNTGGPAFPADSVSTGDGGRIPQKYSGMTLRDYFAAKAMAALICEPSDPHPECALPSEVAETAYLVADAMLKERAK